MWRRDARERQKVRGERDRDRERDRDTDRQTETETEGDRDTERMQNPRFSLIERDGNGWRRGWGGER